MSFIRRKQLWFLVHVASGVTAMALFTAPATASTVSFTIDPTQSFYHIVNIQTDGPSPPAPLANSTILSVPVTPQSAGADTDALSGTISANEAGGVLTFSGTSSISLAANPAGPFLPATNPGTDNFGIVAVGTPAGTIDVAIRNWVFTIQSGTATNGALPSAGSIVLASTAGYQQNSVTGQASLVGQSGADVATTPISLTTSGGIETLVLPVIRLPVAGTPGQIYIEGTIVATRSVPEPGTLALASVALVGLGLVVRRQRKD